MTQLSVRSVVLMLVAMTLIPIGDSAGKLLVQSHAASPFFVGWSRFALGAIVVWVGLKLGRLPVDLHAFRNWRLWLRGALIGCGVASIVTALRTEPIAAVFGAFFIGPILSYFLSAWALKEPLSHTRTLLLLVGFVGVLLVVKPGFGMSPGIGFAVLAGCFYAGYLTASRWLRAAASTQDLLFTQLVAAMLLLTPLGAFNWPVITTSMAGLTVVSALGSMLGNLLLILAYRQAPAGLLAPFIYFQLVAATALGWLVFATLPDQLALIGLLVLTTSGFATLWVRR